VDSLTRQFLISFDKLDIDASNVKSGHNSRNVVVACRCVNVGLFLSNNLRRDVKVSLSTGTSKDLKVITFPGSTIRRVSPDERSIAFFLLKASDILDEMQMNSRRTMDNGIELHRTTLKNLFDQWLEEECYIALQAFNVESDFSSVSESGLYIYDMNPENPTMMNYPIKAIPRPPHPERFILEINLNCDKQA
jgi:tRNA pseudouridine-54 N-methylase